MPTKKTSPIDVKLAYRPRKKKAPTTAFKKGGENKFAFKPGASPNPGGKIKKNADAYLGKTILAGLAERAPDEIARKVGLWRGQYTWGQLLTRRLLVMALAGVMTAFAEIRQFTQALRIDMRGMFSLDDSGADAPALMELVFLESNGDGRLRPADLAAGLMPAPAPALPEPLGSSESL